MKRFAMLILCHALYELGALVSKLDIFDRVTFYPLYNWLMMKSFNINERYGFSVWL